MGGRQSSPGRSLVTAGLPCRKGMCVAIGHSRRGTATLKGLCVAKHMEPSPISLETQRAVFAAAGRTVMHVEIDARWSHAPVRRPGGRLSACRVDEHGLVGADESTSWARGFAARFIDSVFLAIVGGAVEEQTQ